MYTCAKKKNKHVLITHTLRNKNIILCLKFKKRKKSPESTFPVERHLLKVQNVCVFEGYHFSDEE